MRDLAIQKAAKAAVDKNSAPFDLIQKFCRVRIPAFDSVTERESVGNLPAVQRFQAWIPESRA